MLLFKTVVLISDVLARDDFVVMEVYVCCDVYADEVMVIKCRLYTIGWLVK